MEQRVPMCPRCAEADERAEVAKSKKRKTGAGGGKGKGKGKSGWGGGSSEEDDSGTGSGTPMGSGRGVMKVRPQAEVHECLGSEKWTGLTAP